MSNNQDYGKQTSMLTKPFGGNSINSEPLMLDPSQLHSNEQRQAALASLFSSLSSLTANQQLVNSANNYHQSLTIPPPPPPPPQLQTTATTASLIAQNSPVFEASSSASMTLTSSIQSFVAAAMMQQQLVTAALKQQQQQSQNRITTPPSQPQQQLQPISYLGEQMRSDFAPNVTNFDHQDVQLSGFNPPQLQQQQQQEQQQQQARINYCTICNKELCNKYFMKTHMLKMHGINLETEQPEEENNAGHGGDNNNESDAQSDAKDQHQGNNSNNRSFTSQNNKTTPNKKVGSPSSTTLMKKSMSTTQGKHQQATTSVMNGFAGNSMGGVVCDICNKELCSKYFLKVHKQNTHGVNTDSQDASQFMYPFAPNPFMAAAPIGLTPPALGLPTNPIAFLSSQQQQQQQNEVQISKSLSPSIKRPKYMIQRPQDSGNLEPKNGATHKGHGAGRQADNDTTAYRLNSASTKQQQLAAGGQSLGSSIVPLDTGTLGPASMPYCFGAINPFVPKVTPTMIVDYILQNQHLFNRNNRNDSNNTTKHDATKPNQNNKPPAAEQSKQKSKGAKESQASTNSNGKYFNHYTEACPMCDRRFKSIKWLKTHMMNDHKQEIGAYMQMMMPYMPYSPSQQQMAAAVAARTMASTLNHHQQQNNQQANQLIFQQAHCGNHQKQMKPNAVATKCYNPSPSGQDQNQPINFMSQLQEQLIRGSPTESLAANGTINQDLIIDARRRHDSISPSIQSNHNNNNNNDIIKLETTMSSQLELNFELDHLRQPDDDLNIDQFDPSNDSFDEDSDHQESPIEYSVTHKGSQRLVHLASGDQTKPFEEEADNEEDEQLDVKDLTRGSDGGGDGSASVQIRTSTR